MDSESVGRIAVGCMVVLIAILAVREVARGPDPSPRPPAAGILDVAVMIMVVVVVGAGGLFAAALVAGDGRAGDPRPATGTAARPSPRPPEPTPARPSASAAGSSTPSGPPVTSTPRTVRPSHAATAGPTAGPTPGPTTAPVDPAAGFVEAGPTLRTYEVQGPQVSGFADRRMRGRLRVEVTAPVTYAFPSFTDPGGTIRLVLMLNGPHAGAYVSPDDAGVTFRAR